MPFCDLPSSVCRGCGSVGYCRSPPGDGVMTNGGHLYDMGGRVGITLNRGAFGAVDPDQGRFTLLLESEESEC